MALEANRIHVLVEDFTGGMLYVSRVVLRPDFVHYGNVALDSLF